MWHSILTRFNSVFYDVYIFVFDACSNQSYIRCKQCMFRNWWSSTFWNLLLYKSKLVVRMIRYFTLMESCKTTHTTWSLFLLTPRDHKCTWYTGWYGSDMNVSVSIWASYLSKILNSSSSSNIYSQLIRLRMLTLLFATTPLRTLHPSTKGYYSMSLS